ncbi:hypothetical protein ACS0TY_009204 [Phlomoides rotata]
MLLPCAFQGCCLGILHLILSALFVNSFVIIFVVIVLLAALDFWVVKNVSGRILVGLRWWNEINDDGESVWKFECLDQESLARMNKKDSWLFNSKGIDDIEERVKLILDMGVVGEQ